MSLLDRLVERLEMLLVKALLKKVDDSGAIQLIKISGLAGEEQDGIERLQNYGMSSSPPVESETFLAYLNGNREHGVAVVIDSGEFRPRSLKEGENVVYSKHGQTILLNDAGEIVFNKGTDYMVAFNELKAGVDQLVSDFNKHIHATTATPGVSTVPGVISTPYLTAAAVPPAPINPCTASVDASKIVGIRVP